MKNRELIKLSKERKIKYYMTMTKVQKCDILVENDKDPSITCIPSVKDKAQAIKQAWQVANRERACQYVKKCQMKKKL